MKRLSKTSKALLVAGASFALVATAALPAYASTSHHTCTSGSVVYGTNGESTASTYVESGSCGILAVRVQLEYDGSAGEYSTWYEGATDAVYPGPPPTGYTIIHAQHSAAEYADVFTTST